MSARGFTLIESLVALVVLSVGLLGAAATLLGSLGAHAEALRRASALELVRDIAERIRANPRGRAAYDTNGAAAAAADCSSASVDAAARAACDRAHFAAAARASFPFAAPQAAIRFEPATGADTPERYEITLRLTPRSQPGALEGVALTVWLLAPVAGA